LQPWNGVASLDLNDRSPGAPLEQRRLPSGITVLIMKIIGDPRVPSKAELVLRCDPDGRTYAALGRGPSSDVHE
jgi:hypothetical protein